MDKTTATTSQIENLRYGALKQQVDEITGKLRNLPPSTLVDSLFGLTTFGFKFIEIEPKIVQKIKIRDSFEWCSDEFRAEMNAWLLEMFGTEDLTLIPKGTGYLIAGEYLLVRKDDKQVIKMSVV